MKNRLLMVLLTLVMILILIPQAAFAMSESELALKPNGRKQAKRMILFYDELRSYFKSINYHNNQLYDLGDMVAFLGTADVEQDKEAEEKGDYSNIYSDLAKRLRALFPVPDHDTVIENDFMYAAYTLNEQTAPNYYYDEEAEQQRAIIISLSATASSCLPI